MSGLRQARASLCFVAAVCTLHPATRAQAPSPDLAAQHEALQQDLQAQQERKAALAAAEEALTQSRRTTLARLRQRVGWLYRLSRGGMLPLAGGMKAVMSHLAHVKRLQRLVREDANALAALEARAKELAREEQTLAETGERLTAKLEELKQAERALAKVADGMARALEAPGHTGPSGKRRSAGDPAQSGLATRHGRLPLPIVGEFRMREARRAESDGPGLELLCPAGTPVRAVAAGRVAFSDRYGSYGRLVILDHQDGYFTVYGGLAGVDVRVGDELSELASIGRVAGEPGPPALFFEVRKGTRTLPPRGWFGL